MRITNFKKKKTKLLTKGQQKSHENAKICYICKEKFENEIVKNKKGYCHHKENIDVLGIAYVI